MAERPKLTYFTVPLLACAVASRLTSLKNTEELRRFKNSATSSLDLAAPRILTASFVFRVRLKPGALGLPIGESRVGILAQGFFIGHTIEGRSLAWARDFRELAQKIDGAGASGFQGLDGLALLEQFLALAADLVVVAKFCFTRHIRLQDGVVVLGFFQLGGGLQVEEDDETNRRQDGESHEQELALAGLVPLRLARGE